MKKEKERIDTLLVETGVAESREKAKRLIMGGAITADGELITKPGRIVSRDSIIVRKKQPDFVGRGGEKLDGFFQDHPFDVSAFICMDVGASTGGFTDCLLQRGASKVYAVDVGRNQIDWKLRNDPRVVVCDEVNARYLSREIIPEQCHLCVMDVSFISVEKILPAIYNLLISGGFVLALIKPQFEAGPDKVGRRGIVKDANVHREVLEKVGGFAERLGLRPLKVLPSRVKGAKGNQEFFILWIKE